MKKIEKQIKKEISRSFIETIGNGSLTPICEIIGIDLKSLIVFFEKKRNNISKFQQNLLVKYLSKIKLLVSDDRFYQNIKLKLLFIKDYGVFVITDNKYIGTFGNNSLHITIKKNNVEFSFTSEDKMMDGKHSKDSNGSHTEYTNYLNILSSDKGCTFFSEIDCFDKNNVQNFKFEKIMNQKSNLDYCNGNVESRWSWKLSDDTIIQKCCRSYEDGHIKCDIDEELLIGRNFSSTKNELIGDNFVFLDDRIYSKYFNGEYTIDDLWKRATKSYQKK